MFDQLLLSCIGVPVCGDAVRNEVMTWLAVTVGLASAGLFGFRRFVKNASAMTKN
jgi:hypothetical protein